MCLLVKGSGDLESKDTCSVLTQGFNVKLILAIDL